MATAKMEVRLGFCIECGAPSFEPDATLCWEHLDKFLLDKSSVSVILPQYQKIGYTYGKQRGRLFPEDWNR